MRITTIIAEIIFLPAIFIHYAAAQKDELRFNLVTGPHGKPLGKIRNITQDPHGYMWFSGEDERCIYRYDGIRLSVFRHDDSDSNSLAGTVVNSVYADDSGLIWIGLNNGLDQYNPSTGIFTHYRHRQNDPGSLNAGDVAPIIRDRKGRLWVGGSNGLDRLDEKTGKFIHYRNEQGNQKSLSSNFIWTIYEDKQGVIWIGTGYPWFNKDPENGGLNRLEDNGSFSRFMHNPKDPHSLINNKVGAIFEDTDGVFWIGTSGDGLHTMDRKTGLFQRHLYDPKKPEQLSRPPLHPAFGPNDKINFITQDSTGAIWIGTEFSGINRYNPKTEKITLFKHSNGFPDSSGWNAFVSRDGVLWITTEDRNLYKTDPFNKSIYSIGPFHLPSNFMEDEEGYLWVSTMGSGLLKFDQNRNLLKQYKHDPSDSFSLLDDNTGMMIPYRDKTFLVCSHDGIRVFNKLTGKFSRFQDTEAFKDSVTNGFSNILRDKQGLMWFCRWGLGLIRYNPKDNSTKQFFADQEDSTSIGSNFLNSILEDSFGVLWTAGLGGINRLNKETYQFKHYLPRTFITYLYKDSRGILWAGTERGLYRYHQKEDRFTGFFDPQSEISSFRVGGIIEDNARNLWLTSESAIIKLNPVTKETFIYGDKFGITPNSLAPYTKTYKNRKGQLFMGHGRGFYFFSPEELTVSNKLKIIVTDLFINTLPMWTGKSGSLQKPVEEISELNLKYNQNNIVFNFATIDYRAPEHTKYFTMLEGYDDTWREATGEKSSSYFYVPPDKYVYRIKAYNSEGVMAEKAIIIRITPPWWNTWLFRISAVIFFGSIFYGIMRWRMQQKFKLKLEASERERQMAELKQKGTELEMQALRAQMNPHFIFNSLNSINRFILQNNKAQASEYLTKFSKLVRMILQNSQASLITLESELESLELYLNLESLRFNYHFDYKISVVKEIDISVLKVPPLILQPYVENAIWHGLMHKEEKGQLDIEIIQESDHLCFKITDNGIGREKAATLASKSATKHKSMGLRITADRIAILHNSQTLTSPVTVNDLVDAEGNGAGTEVIIKTPIIYD